MRESKGDLSISEQLVLDTLAEAWNQYQKLPVLHQWDKQEFMHAIHQAQNIVLARPALRNMKESHGTS